jgi:hypothetical protein
MPAIPLGLITRNVGRKLAHLKVRVSFFKKMWSDFITGQIISRSDRGHFGNSEGAGDRPAEIAVNPRGRHAETSSPVK